MTRTRHALAIALLVTAGCGDDAGAPPAADARFGACPVDGWCWSTPRPQGNELIATWASGPNDVWAVGAVGTIVHWDGVAWSSVASGTTNDLWNVWGSGPNDVWATGVHGTIVHWNGAAWSPTASGTTFDLAGLWGSGRDDVWIIANTDSSMESNGVPLHDMGFALHWNGRAWTQQNIDTKAALWGIWGSGPGDIWMVGNDDTGAWVVLRGDGRTWSEIARGDGTSSASGIWGTGPDDVWIYGFLAMLRHWDGKTWTNLDGALGTVENVAQMGGSGPQDTWAIGTDFGAAYVSVARWDGSAWDTSSTLADGSLFGAWWIDASDAWVVGGGGSIRHWDGAAWNDAVQDVTFEADQHNWLGSVWGSADDDVWAAGNSGVIVHWDGASWSRVPIASTGPVGGLWGSGPDDIWAVAQADSVTILHWGGQAWSTAVSEPPTLGDTENLTAVWGSGPDDVWAVGRQRYGGKQLVYHWDGNTWTRDASRKGSLLDVWGSGPGDVWAVGLQGLIIHWDGSAWSTVESGTTGGLHMITGTGANDVWVTGATVDATGVSSAMALRWNGTAWSTFAGVPDVGLERIWGRRADDLWATSFEAYRTTILHWNGAAWSPVPTRLSGLQGISAFWGDGSGEVWAVGNGILHHAAGR
jgi:hypothetical protein